jgi:hypothetical protein
LTDWSLAGLVFLWFAIASGLAFDDMHLITPLAEYRNGGLLVDTGVLTPLKESSYQRTFAVGSELVVEVGFSSLRFWHSVRNSVSVTVVRYLRVDSSSGTERWIIALQLDFCVSTRDREPSSYGDLQLITLQIGLSKSENLKIESPKTSH